MRFARRAAAMVLGALVLSACGGSGGSPPCAVLQNGNQLCGNALVAWCSLNQVGVNPSASSTLEACQAAGRWATRGQKVITVTPGNVGSLSGGKP